MRGDRRRPAPGERAVSRSSDRRGKCRRRLRCAPRTTGAVPAGGWRCGGIGRSAGTRPNAAPPVPGLAPRRRSRRHGRRSSNPGSPPTRRGEDDGIGLGGFGGGGSSFTIFEAIATSTGVVRQGRAGCSSSRRVRFPGYRFVEKDMDAPLILMSRRLREQRRGRRFRPENRGFWTLCQDRSGPSVERPATAPLFGRQGGWMGPCESLTA